MALSRNSSLLLKVLLHRYHGDGANAAAALLPDADAALLREMPIIPFDTGIEEVLTHPEELIKEVHYSWLAPIVEHHPSRLQPLLLACLTVEQRSKLAPLLAIEAQDTRCSENLKAFLLRLLWDELKPEQELLPLAFLPQSPLLQLFSYDKEAVITLIDYLGLYDLADVVRHIVDKSKLKLLLECLDSHQQRFLRSCLHHNVTVALPGFDLDGWKGDKSKLRHLLHRRGLLRLAKTLAGCGDDFLWHFVHRLDTGRGTLILRDYSDNREVAELIRPQLLNIMNFIDPKQEKMQ